MNATVYSMKDYPEENPTCCKKFEHDTTWDCVQIGDHPKFGFKCVEIYGIEGQFETKQECLRSGCEGIADPAGPTTTVGGLGAGGFIAGSGSADGSDGYTPPSIVSEGREEGGDEGGDEGGVGGLIGTK